MQKTNKILRGKNIKASKLSPSQIDAYEKEWFGRIVPVDLREKALECYCFPRDGFSGYLWHVFSFDLLPCLESDEARKAYDALERGEAILLSNWDDTAFQIADASALNSSDFDEMDDIILTDIHFQWIYVKTHESYLGPHFYRTPE